MGGQYSDHSPPPFPSPGASLAEPNWEHERGGPVRDQGPGRRREDGNEGREEGKENSNHSNSHKHWEEQVAASAHVCTPGTVLGTGGRDE